MRWVAKVVGAHAVWATDVSAYCLELAGTMGINNAESHHHWLYDLIALPAQTI